MSDEIMKAWSCNLTARCPLFRSSSCGYDAGKPLLLSYHPEPDLRVIPECYVEHVISCWDEWEKLAPRWKNSVKRILSSVTNTQLDEKYFQIAMDLIILHHDVGKLTEEYQRGEFFRHEIISAYILYNQLKKIFREDEPSILSSIFASAVYLHHEALQISHNYLEMREPTYSYLLHLLSSKTFNMLVYSNEVISRVNQHFITYAPSFAQSIIKLIKGIDIANTLSLMIFSVDGHPNPLAIRMGVAAVLHPLTICDNLAANRRRGMPSNLSKALISFFKKGAIAVMENE